MAVPKGKVSKARRNKRRGKLEADGSQSDQVLLWRVPYAPPYRPACGMYDGRSYAKVRPMPRSNKICRGFRYPL